MIKDLNVITGHTHGMAAASEAIDAQHRSMPQHIELHGLDGTVLVDPTMTSPSPYSSDSTFSREVLKQLQRSLTTER